MCYLHFSWESSYIGRRAFRYLWIFILTVLMQVKSIWSNYQWHKAGMFIWKQFKSGLWLHLFPEICHCWVWFIYHACCVALNFERAPFTCCQTLQHSLPLLSHSCWYYHTKQETPCSTAIHIESHPMKLWIPNRLPLAFNFIKAYTYVCHL